MQNVQNKKKNIGKEKVEKKSVHLKMEKRQTYTALRLWL